MLTHFRSRCAGALALACVLSLVPLTARAQTQATTADALLRLLQVLRDRGSISAAEYEELRLVAGASEPPAASPAVSLPASASAPAQAALVAPPPAPGPDAWVETAEALLAQASAQPAAQAAATAPPSAAPDAAAQAATADLVQQALAGKWYERIGLRGYTQFRLSDVLSSEGAPVLVPSDRSVNENESLMIRRGRFVFSGDPTEHLALYAQMDFNGSTGAADYSLQMRDLYADVSFDAAKTFRARVGQSKVPFGFVNLQSSQNRAPLERPDALNSAVEGERDLGAYLMWAPVRARQVFRDSANRAVKGSGDYGVVAVGVFGGQGLNRSDQNGDLHWVARASYPFSVGGQIVELGVQGYTGAFVTATQAITVNGASLTPVQQAGGVTDERVGVTAVWYPQPFGLEAEWNVGRGPTLSADRRTVESASLSGGYVQLHYRQAGSTGIWFPFTRWQYYDGGRKFARNAPRVRVNELDLGLEFAKWAEVELTMMYTHTFQRTQSSTFPYLDARHANRVGFQVQWNY